jgi:hypothetical protein
LIFSFYPLLVAKEAAIEENITGDGNGDKQLNKGVVRNKDGSTIIRKNEYERLKRK